MDTCQSEFLNAVLDAASDCITVISAEGSLVLMSRAGLEMFEVSALEDVQLFGLINYVVPQDRSAFKDLLRRVMAGERAKLEFGIIANKGTLRWMEIHASPLFDKVGAVCALIGNTRDITERRELMKELEMQAQIDCLTGLPNRRHFFALADHELYRLKRYGGAMSLLMLDVDRFKEINDRHGHKAGDLALVALARVCKEVLREIDVVGRLGGEEFAILLPEIDRTKSFEVAERLRQCIANMRLQISEECEISMTVSFGLTSLNSNVSDLESMIQQADKALYKAKTAGRNQVHEYRLD